MLKYVDYDIVFQEIPDHTTLAVNLSCCPNRCAGCHSPHLWEDAGEELTDGAVGGLLERYGGLVTCFCLMGGDNDPQAVQRVCRLVRRLTSGRVATAWYSGRQELPAGFDLGVLDYLKLGPWIEARGTLRDPSTNQRLYRLFPDGRREDLTSRFRR